MVSFDTFKKYNFKINGGDLILQKNLPWLKTEYN